MKKFTLCKLFLVALLVVGAVKPAVAGKISWQIDTNNNSRLSEITENPAGVSFDGLTVYKFEIEHGACGGDRYWSDCNGDRQRVELRMDTKPASRVLDRSKKK